MKRPLGTYTVEFSFQALKAFTESLTQKAKDNSALQPFLERVKNMDLGPGKRKKTIEEELRFPYSSPIKNAIITIMLVFLGQKILEQQKARIESAMAKHKARLEAYRHARKSGHLMETEEEADVEMQATREIDDLIEKQEEIDSLKGELDNLKQMQMDLLVNYQTQFQTTQKQSVATMKPIVNRLIAQQVNQNPNHFSAQQIVMQAIKDGHVKGVSYTPGLELTPDQVVDYKSQLSEEDVLSAKTTLTEEYQTNHMNMIENFEMNRETPSEIISKVSQSDPSVAKMLEKAETDVTVRSQVTEVVTRKHVTLSELIARFGRSSDLVEGVDKSSIILPSQGLGPSRVLTGVLELKQDSLSNSMDNYMTKSFEITDIERELLKKVDKLEASLNKTLDKAEKLGGKLDRQTPSVVEGPSKPKINIPTIKGGGPTSAA